MKIYDNIVHQIHQIEISIDDAQLTRTKARKATTPEADRIALALHRTNKLFNMLNAYLKELQEPETN